MLFQTNNIQNNIISIGFSLIPVSFMLGNSAINLNIFLILIYSLFLFRFQIFKIDLTFLDKIIIIFFTYTMLNGILNNFFNFNFTEAPDQNVVIKKSFLYLRFLLIYFILRFLISKKLINYKMIFLSFGFCSLFVSIDIIIQFIFGKDIFGIESSDRRLSGLFAEEKIAGSFIQRFFIFLPYSLIIFSQIKSKFTLNFFFLLMLILILFGTVLSGNRVPFFMLIISLIFLGIFEKKFRLNLFVIFTLFLVGLFYLTIERGMYKHHYKNFIFQSLIVTEYFKNKINTGKVIAPDYCKNIDVKTDNSFYTPEESKLISECSKYLNVYIKEFESGINTWEKNKIFGGGIKSFRFNCSRIERSKMEFFVSKKGNVNCNNHPHNYYLQIAAELGIVGLLLVIFLFTIIMIKCFNYLKSKETNFHEKRVLLPFFIIFMLEVFPFKTSGSFFTTANSTFIFIILSFVISLIQFKKYE